MSARSTSRTILGASTAGAGPDGRLIELAAELVAVQARIDAHDAQGAAAVDAGDSGLQQHHDAAMEALQVEAFWPVATEIADTPARTPEGIQAKARALRIVWHAVETDTDSHPARHALGLVRDILGEGCPWTA